MFYKTDIGTALSNPRISSRRKLPSMASFRELKLVTLFVSLLFLQVSVINGHAGGDHDADSSSSDSNIRSKGLILVKVYCLIILLVFTFAGGISPYFFRWNESFLLLGTQFAGGVFLGTSMMHFLSDANETFGNLMSKEYPFAFMLACCGYLLTMFGDCVVSLVTRKPNQIEDAESPKEDAHDSHGHTDLILLSSESTSFGDTILLIAALCFHSLFEGIAVGVSGSKSEAWRNLWTISLHKVFAAVAMGIALLKMLPERPLLLTCAYSFAFAVSSPVGVAIGIAIDSSTEGHAVDWVYAISMGIACGVFIYVAINHLIAKGFKPLEKCYFDTPFYKFLAVVLGVGVIAVAMIWD